MPGLDRAVLGFPKAHPENPSPVNSLSAAPSKRAEPCGDLLRECHV